MTEDKHTRYHQRQREKGYIQCTTWVPAASKVDLLEYARKLRKRHEAKMERGKEVVGRHNTQHGRLAVEGESNAGQK